MAAPSPDATAGPARLLRVEAEALHLRSSPEARPSTRLAVLPHGHLVEERAPDGTPEVRPGWLKVVTTLDGREVSGFVAGRFLDPVEVRAALPAADSREEAAFVPPEAHLSHGHRAVVRSRAGGRAHPLGERGAPRRDLRRSPRARARAVDRIIDWLAVESSARYLRSGGATYCNVYACDCCYLAGAYLPRVWWIGAALAAIASGREAEARYGATVRELTANDLFDWLREWGPRYGWRRTFDPGEARSAVTDGAVGLVCAQRRDRDRPGHITVIVPDPEPPRADSPLRQSQAGTVNRRRFRSRWWRHDRFRDHGIFLHP